MELTGPSRLPPGPSAGVSLRPDLPIVGADTVPTTSPVPRAGPSNLLLNGTQVMVVSTNLTVRNVTLADNATLYLHNPNYAVTLTVLGNILLENDALFFANHSNLAIGEAYDVEWELLVHDRARFILGFANVTTNGYQWGAAYENAANVTVVDSVVAHPAGWVDTDLTGRARLTLYGSWYSSDIVFFDNPLLPSTTNLSAGASAGFNVWLNFKHGTSANLSLPAPLGWRNWSFPGTAAVAELNYSIWIVDCFVLLFAVMVWQGSHVALHDAPGFVASIDLLTGVLSLTGLAEGVYSSYAIASDGYDLTLRNATVFTWNLYPFGGTLDVSHSAVGEVQVFNAASALVANSTLTGHGGYYGEQGSGTLTIRDSSVASEVAAYDGLTTLSNCTINSPGTVRVLAVGTGTLVSLDTSLGAGANYATVNGGFIEVEGLVTANVTLGGVAASSGTVSAISSPLGHNLSALLGGSGSWAAPLIGETYALGRRPLRFNYTLEGRSLGGLGEAPAPVPTRALWVPLALTQVVQSTNPANGAVDVPIANETSPVPSGLRVTVTFGLAMDPSTTEGSVTVSPTVPFADSLLSGGSELVVLLSSPLAWNTTYTVTIAASATTAFGMNLSAPYAFTFTTTTALVPFVTASNPPPGAVGVSVATNITLEFNTPMNASSVGDAFAISPNVPGAVLTTPSKIVFTPNFPFAYNTTYAVTLTPMARSALGVGLGQGYGLSFTTQANPNLLPHHPPGHNATSSGGLPLADWALLAAVAIVAVLAALVLLGRRRRPSAAPPVPVAAAPAATDPVPKPSWSEDDEPVRPR